MKRVIYLLILAAVVLTLTGCRGSKSVTTHTTQTGQNDVSTDITAQESTKVDQKESRTYQKYVDEKLAIHVNSKVYDTDKPANPETGMHPLKEETNVTLSGDTNQREEETVQAETAGTSDLQFSDKSTDRSKVNSAEKTTTKTGLAAWQKVLIAIGLAAIAGLALFIYKKIKSR